MKRTTTISLDAQAAFYLFCLYEHERQRKVGSRDGYYGGAAASKQGILYLFQAPEEVFLEFRALAGKLAKEKPDGLTMDEAKKYAEDLLSKYLDDQ